MKTFQILLLSIITLLVPRILLAQTPDDFNPNAGGVVSLAVQPDGKVLMGGHFTSVGGVPRNRIARVNVDGTLDHSFNPNADSVVQSIALQADGKILIGGEFNTVGGVTRFRIARLNADGTLDNSFNPGGSQFVFSICIQNDGKILVGGQFSSVGGVARNNIARLNPDGTVDGSFNPNCGGTVYSIVEQPDGKILTGGWFSTVSGVARNNVARLNGDGTLDTSFNPNASSAVFSLAIQADSKVLIGGDFTTVGGVTRSRIARLNADGTLDNSFNPNASGRVDSLALQADGKILMGGLFTSLGGVPRNRIARINADGSLDGSFDPNANDYVGSLAVQTDGKILIAGGFNTVGGATRGGVARLTNNIAAMSSLTVTGTSQIDWTRDGSAPELAWVTFESWNGSAWVSEGAATRVAGGWRRSGISLSASGWIRARGGMSSGARNSSASIIGQISTYGTGGFPDIALSVDGENLTSGSGTVDFGANAWATGSTTKTFTITNMGDAPLTGLEIALGGSDSNDFTVSTLDATTVAPEASTSFTVTFSPVGVGNRGALIAIASNDLDESPFQISLAGIGVQSDSSFDPSVNDTVQSLAVQPDGKILIGGYFTAVGAVNRNRIARINADGTLDSSFNPNANSGVVSLAVQNDGKTLIAGQFDTVGGVVRNRIARLNADGTLDNSFNPNVNSIILCMAVQADGKILIGGSFTTVAGVTRNRIARLNSDGSLDSSFNPNVDSDIYSLAIQPDGKILLGGFFSTVGGVSRNRIARLNADGTLDNSFNPDANGSVYSFAVQADGKIIVGGFFTTLGGVTRNRIARLNTDGTLDSSFNPNLDSGVFSLSVQTDGRILIGGFLTAVGGVTRNRVARLNSDGTLDISFNPNANSGVWSLALQADGKILIGGSFSNIGGVARNRLARLSNNIAATSNLSVSGTTQIDWARGGACPEMEQVIFESWNGSSWVSLGVPARVSGGWRLTGLSLPVSGQIRARGRATGGIYNGSSSLIEQQTAYSLVPEIAVSGNGVEIVNGDATPDPADHTDFGQVRPSGGSLARVFTITNSGSGELNLSGTPRVSVTGSDAFSITLQPASATVAAGGGTQTFEVTFTPTSAGTHNATISIANDDPDEHPFTFALTGTGNTAPTFAGYNVATPWHTAASISLGKLLAKAVDADGHALTVTAAGPASAQGGTAALQSGSILYTPPAAFSGSDTFSVTLTDDLGAMVSGTVTVTVGPDPNSGGQGLNTPQLTILPGGHVGIAFQGIPGRQYQIQRSSDLSNWTTIATVTAASNGAVEFTDEDPPEGSGFYRLRR